MHVIPNGFLFFQNPTSADWLYAVAALLLGVGVAMLGFAAFKFVQVYQARGQSAGLAPQASEAVGDKLADRLEQSLTQLGEQLKQQHDEQLQALSKLQVAQAPGPAATTPAAAPTTQPTAAEPAAATTAPAATASPAASNSGGDMQAAIALLEDREAQYPERLLAAKDAFEQHLNGPDAAKAYTYLAETYFWLGDYATDKGEREKWFSQGVKVGETAAQQSPNDVAAQLWYAANMGSHGVERGIMASLFYINPIIEHGTKAMDLDDSFFHAAPLRLMGRFFHQCPGWPISKGDINKGMALLEKAVQIGPDFLQNKVYLAEIYMAKRKKREARQLLEEVIAAEPAFLPKMHDNIKAEAKRLLAKA